MAQPATLAEAFLTEARRHGERVFLRDKYERRWHDHSWNEVAKAAGSLRAGLAKLGLKAGERIAILSENCPEWVIVDQAALGMGAVTVPLYTSSSAEDTCHIVKDCGARYVAARGEECIGKLLALASSLPALEAIINIDSRASAPAASRVTPPVLTIRSLSAAEPAPLGQVGRHELATIIYTSGTTGPPKGVMLTHDNILSNVEASLECLDFSGTDVSLSFLPVAHSFERTGGYYAIMMVGGTIAYAESLTRILDNLREIRPTVLLTVPRLLELVYGRVLHAIEEAPALARLLFKAALKVGSASADYRHRGRAVPRRLELAMAPFRRLVFGRIRELFGGRLRYLISGGAPLPVEICRFLAAAEIPILEGYGLTEASPVVSVNRVGRTQVGTVGLPLSNLEVKTAADGELLVRGPSVMKGYYRLEAETRAAIDADGWLHTGDTAEINRDSFIKITGRKKEIIVLSGGENISSARLEGKLASDPYILQACVVGDRRKHVAALLVPNLEKLEDFLTARGLSDKPPEELVAQKELRAFFQARIRELNRSLSDLEAITAFTLLASPFTQENGELTPTLKVRRGVVQEHYRDQIEAMYRK